MDLNAVILAAGQGTRMRSSLPKVLHPFAGKPMLQHVIDSAKSIQAQTITVVYGHGGDKVKASIDDDSLNWVEQAEQLGTGHAVQQAVPHIEDGSRVLILYGDVPLLHQDTLYELAQLLDDADLALLTVKLADPTGYGRIERDAQQRVTRIVEHKDCNEHQLQIDEVNTGIMAVKGDNLKRWLSQLSNNNAQGEYYLTDVVEMAVDEQLRVVTAMPKDSSEVEGVNNRMQLAQLERIYQQNCANELMVNGVSIADPYRFDLRGKLTVERDVFIDINAVIEGHVFIEEGVHIGPNVVLNNCRIGKNARIKANSVIEGAEVGANCSVGPFARLRPGTQLMDDAHVGNFVEVKKSTLGTGSKANHLAYIGDSEIGQRVNIGAGTITCNYDGANKHKTVLEDDVFIGSDTQLVAPVTVGRGATVGAGTTVTKDVEAGTLCISRPEQTTIKGWKRPEKNR